MPKATMSTGFAAAIRKPNKYSPYFKEEEKKPKVDLKLAFDLPEIENLIKETDEILENNKKLMEGVNKWLKVQDLKEELEKVKTENMVLKATIEDLQEKLWANNQKLEVIKTFNEKFDNLLKMNKYELGKLNDIKNEFKKLEDRTITIE